jgi:hypothetical protein
MAVMNMNCTTRVLSATTTSSNIALTPTQANQASVIFYNSGAVPVFIVSARGAAATAVFPTAGTPQNGVVVGPGLTATYTKNINDDFLSCITLSSTATVYVQIGSGE